MKLLCVIGSLQAGGAERVLATLSNSLVQYGYELDIVIFDERDSFYDLDPKINILKLELEPYGKRPWSKVKGMYEQISSLKVLIENEAPDVVISYITEVNIIAVIASKLAKRPILISEHTNFMGLKSTFWKVLRRVVYPFSDQLTVLTNYDWKHYTFVKNKIVLPNPLDLKHNHHEIKREKIILGVGRLVELKGFDRLIKAFSKLKSKDWKLVIIGEGYERGALEDLIVQYNLQDRVILEGLVKDVEAFYKKSSIYVLSSRREGYPMGLCEAMAYGCAPIAFDIITGPSDIITVDKDGILVPDNDIEQLAFEIQNLIDNPKKMESLALEATKIESRLDLDFITKKWIAIIDDIKEDESYS